MEKIKVAMADDNAKFLEELVCRVEEDPACEVVGFAGDGESICKIIRDKQPDVVTLDIIMPRMDGFGVMDDILGDESIKKQPSWWCPRWERKELPRMHLSTAQISITGNPWIMRFC